jgi:hypothetical protein
MNKPGPVAARPLADVMRKTLADAFAKQGFASLELVTRWPDIVGAEIAAHSEPEKIQWSRAPGHSRGQGPGHGRGQAPQSEAPEPGTLLLRVEGPRAVEIQHSSDVILQRVNQFFGWQAVGSLRLRQAPLGRPQPRPRPAAPDPQATAQLAASLPEIADDDLRNALARLGSAIAKDN